MDQQHLHHWYGQFGPVTVMISGSRSQIFDATSQSGRSSTQQHIQLADKHTSHVGYQTELIGLTSPAHSIMKRSDLVTRGTEKTHHPGRCRHSSSFNNGDLPVETMIAWSRRLKATQGPEPHSGPWAFTRLGTKTKRGSSGHHLQVPERRVHGASKRAKYSVAYSTLSSV